MLPGSAVPLRLLPLLRLTVGVVGATPSTVVLPWPLVLPAGSVAVALTTVPSASGVDGVKLQSRFVAEYSIQLSYECVSVLFPATCR